MQTRTNKTMMQTNKNKVVCLLAPKTRDVGVHHPHNVFLKKCEACATERAHSNQKRNENAGKIEEKKKTRKIVETKVRDSQRQRKQRIRPNLELHRSSFQLKTNNANNRNMPTRRTRKKGGAHARTQARRCRRKGAKELKCNKPAVHCEPRRQVRGSTTPRFRFLRQIVRQFFHPPAELIFLGNQGRLLKSPCKLSCLPLSPSNTVLAFLSCARQCPLVAGCTQPCEALQTTSEAVQTNERIKMHTGTERDVFREIGFSAHG